MKIKERMMMILSKTKKFLTLLLAALFILSALTGCGEGGNQGSSNNGSSSSDQSDSGEPIEITLWFWGVVEECQEHFRKVIDEKYNNVQDQYKLVIEFRNTVDKDVPTALAANSGPDIVYSSGPAFVSIYAQEGKVLNLDEYAEQYGWKDSLQSVLYDACTLNGSLYSIPTSMTFDGIYYSKSLFEEKGWEIPETIADLEAIFDAAIADGMYAAAIGNKGWRPNNDTYASIMVNHFASPSLLYDALTGNGKFDTPEMREAIAKSKEWYDKGYLGGSDYTNLNAQECFQLLVDHRATVVFSQSKFFQQATSCFTGEKEEDLGFVPMPSLYETDMPVYNLEIASTLSINAATKYPDECAKILNILTQEDFLMDMTEVWPGHWAGALKERTASTDSLTGTKKLFMDSAITASASIAEGYFGYNASTFFPPQTTEKWRDIDMVWQGVVTPEEYLQTLDETVVQEIEDNLVCPLAKPAI